MKNKIYEITYMYEIEEQEYVDQTVPELGIKVRTSFTKRSELSVGKTPAKAIFNWEKKIHKRERKAKEKTYIIEIKEYNITTTSES